MAAAGVDFDAALCKVVLDTLVFVGLPLQMGRFLWASLCALPDGYMKQQILFALGELAWAPREPGAADSDETAGLSPGRTSSTTLRTSGKMRI